MSFVQSNIAKLWFVWYKKVLVAGFAFVHSVSSEAAFVICGSVVLYICSFLPWLPYDDDNYKYAAW